MLGVVLSSLQCVEFCASESSPAFSDDGCVVCCAAGFLLPHQRPSASPQHQIQSMQQQHTDLSQPSAQLPSSPNMMAGHESGQAGAQPQQHFTPQQQDLSSPGS